MPVRLHCRQETNVERGFILALTLWIIAAIGLVIVAVNTWVSQATENARILKQQADFEVAQADIRNELIFALGTRPLTHRGMEVGKLIEMVDRSDANALMTADFATDSYIKMDGRPYKLESHPDYILRIYDGRGLVNLNAISAPYLRRLLGLFNVSEPIRNSMVDSLEDYSDRDDLTRISGAEEKDYVKLGRQPPANAWLMTPMEAAYVMNWDLVPDLWRRDLDAPLISTCAVSGFNPNTASREALLSNFSGLAEEDLKDLLIRRNERPFRNIREFAAAANTTIRDEPFSYTFAPGSCIIVEVTHQPSGERSRFSLTIDTFSAKTKPWRIDYAFPIPSKTSAADRQLAPEEIFPAPESLDANDRASLENSGAGSSNAMGRESLNDATPNF